MAKSVRNKTIDLTIDEGQTYLAKCISINTKQPSLSEIVNKTIIGDSFEVMKHLPEQTIDLAIVDPPYNLTKEFHGVTFTKQSSDAYEEYTRKWLNLLYPLMKDTASIYVCCDWETSLIIGRVLGEFFTVRSRITWQREKGRGAAANWKNGMEDIWFATKSNKYTFNLDAVKIRKKVTKGQFKVGSGPRWKKSLFKSPVTFMAAAGNAATWLWRSHYLG